MKPQINADERGRASRGGVGGIVGAILAGGRSSRMGADKRALPLPDGRLMIDAVAAALEGLCERVVIVGIVSPGLARGGPGIQRRATIADLRPGCGPLGGIEALLASGIADQYLVCPCDLPLMTPEVLRMLCAPSEALATMLRIRNREEPETLPARISAAALPMVRALLDSGRREVWALMQALPAEVVVVEPQHGRAFTNVNTPADVAALQPGQARG